MSKEQNEVLEQQRYLLERRMYRLDPAPPKLPTAVRVASENVSHNNLDSVITVRQGDLLAGTEGTADIIVANIVADVILQLLPDVPARLNKGGYFVASGIISERLGEITHGAMTCGLTVDRVVERDGWAVVVSHKEED